MKEYPDELTVVFFYNVTATIVATTVGLFTEPNASAWKIRLDMSLLSIVCSVRYPWKLQLHFDIRIYTYTNLYIDDTFFFFYYY